MNSHLLSGPRFQVTTGPDGRALVRPGLPTGNIPVVIHQKVKRDRHPAKLIPAGSVAVQVFGRAPGPFTIAWRERAGGPRRRAMRSTWAKAKKFAESIATNLANGQTAMNAFTEADRAELLAAREKLAPSGQSLLSAAAEHAEWKKRLAAAGASFETIATFYEQNRPRGYVPHPIPKLVELFLADMEGQLSKDWFAHLTQNLGRFAAHFACELHAVQSVDLNTWLRALKGHGGAPLSSRTRHNYRASVEQLATWAQANNHLPRTWTEMERVNDPGTKVGTVKIWTPQDLLKLLTARQHAEQLGRARKKSLIPFIACQAFAGIRHEELARRDLTKKERLDWRDVHLKARFINLKAEVSKTGVARAVPISKNLAAWLAPYAKRSGPVCELDNASSALTRAKQAAGLAAGKNQSHNILRHSAISYRLALAKHIGMVAEEAGNSPGIIRKHYRAIIPPNWVDGQPSAETGAEKEGQWPLEPDAERWFALAPAAAEVLQLNFAGM